MVGGTMLFIMDDGVLTQFELEVIRHIQYLLNHNHTMTERQAIRKVWASERFAITQRELYRLWYEAKTQGFVIFMVRKSVLRNV
jgi:hypothetical protein